MSFAVLASAGPAAARYPESPADSYRPPLTWAVPLHGLFESPFGPRWGKLHAGVDIAVLGDDRVHAARPRTVAAVGWLASYSGYGLVVEVRHTGDVTTMYAHLARTLVREGQPVAAGQLVGLAGCTGSCTGQHLHFEVRVRGRSVDPEPFFGKRLRRLH